LKVLLTGFEVFGNLSFNPSQLIVESIARDTFQSIDLFKQVLPVSYQNAFKILKKNIDNISPDAVLMLGVAGKAESVRIEARAANAFNRELKDNDSYLPETSKIIKSGPDVISTQLNTEFILNNLNYKGFNVILSENCGAYLCNYLYYQALHYIDSHQLPVNALFVHVPDIKADESGSEFQSILDEYIEMTGVVIESIAANYINKLS